MRDHGPGHARHANQIALCPGGNFPKGDLFGNAAAERTGDTRIVFGQGHVLRFIFQIPGNTPGHTPRNNGDFTHGTGVGQEVADDGMTGFVIGYQFALCGGDDAAFAFRAKLYPFDGFLEFVHADVAPVAPGGEQGGFVDGIFQVGSHETGGGAGQEFYIYPGGDGFAFHVNTENGFAAANVRFIQHHPPVKSAWPHQSRVQNVGPVGRRQNNHMGVRAKPIHLDQNLVERLLPFVVRTAQTGPTLPSHRINFVNKDDARAVPFGLFKKVPYPAGPHTHKHLHKFRTSDGEERHTRFPGHSLG